MKGLKKINIPALLALLLAGALLTSAKTNSTNFDAPSFDEDFSYLEEVEEFVDEYIESITIDDVNETPGVIKIYDENGDLLIEEKVEDDISEETLKLMRQSDFLTEYENTTYYRLNS